MNSRRQNRRRAPRAASESWLQRLRLRFRARTERTRTDGELVAPPRVILARIGAGLAAGVCVALLVGLALSMDTYASRTQQFKVRAFETQGLVRTSEAALVEASGLRVGSPLLGVSVRRVRERLVALPWVQRAEVRIEMPGTVHVSVVEHVPVALVADGDIALVDAGGQVIKSLERGVHHELPVMTGVSLEALRCPPMPTDAASSEARPAKRRGKRGRKGGTRNPRHASRAALSTEDPHERAAQCALARRTLQRMLLVARHWGETSVAQRFPVGEVSWDPVLGLTVLSARDGAEVRLGHRDGDDLARVIAQLDRLLTALDKRGERLRYALMDDVARPDQAVIDAVPADKWAALPPLRRAAGPARPRLPAAPNDIKQRNERKARSAAKLQPSGARAPQQRR